MRSSGDDGHAGNETWEHACRDQAGGSTVIQVYNSQINALTEYLLADVVVHGY